MIPRCHEKIAFRHEYSPAQFQVHLEEFAEFILITVAQGQAGDLGHQEIGVAERQALAAAGLGDFSKVF